MKKVIALVGFIMSSALCAAPVMKMPMQDLLRTDMDYVYEIKTTKFDKVLLDCQSLRMGMSFSNGGVVKSDIYLNTDTCGQMVDFLYESKAENLPVCIGLDDDSQELTISREVEECI